jgi:hypothetical protein
MLIAIVSQVVVLLVVLAAALFCVIVRVKDSTSA